MKEKHGIEISPEKKYNECIHERKMKTKYFPEQQKNATNTQMKEK